MIILTLDKPGFIRVIYFENLVDLPECKTISAIDESEDIDGTIKDVLESDEQVTWDTNCEWPVEYQHHIKAQKLRQLEADILAGEANLIMIAERYATVKRELALMRIEAEGLRG